MLVFLEIQPIISKITAQTLGTVTPSVLIEVVNITIDWF